MKKSSFTLLLSLLFIFPSVNSWAQPPSACKAFEGVWEYDLEAARGLWFAKNGRYLYVIVPKERKEFSGGDPSTTEKATAFDGLNISYGTLSCDNKKGVVTQVYAKNPVVADNTFSFEFEIQGNQGRYWVIQPDGSRGAEGQAHKIADFDKSGKKDCQEMSGFWEYNLPDREGIAVSAGEYFAWILVNKEFWSAKKSPDSAESKAQAFDNISAAAGTFSCDDQGIFTWNRIHAHDYRAEGVLFSSENKFEKNSHSFQVLDENGNPTDLHGTCDRLE